MKKPVSAKQNSFFNGESIDDKDLTLEQDYNNTIQTSIINNHIGSGVLAETLTQNVIFDSEKATGLLDGKATSVQNQPADSNFGNQLEVSLIGSEVSGKRAIKLLVIGLDFDGNLQYDRFVFHKNEKQLSRSHYTRVLKILFNDFIGDENQSFNLGGQLLIKEAKSLILSRDCIMVAQDFQPNIFLRDFFVGPSETLNSILTTALPTYNVDTLDMASGYLQLRQLVENDVSFQIGQKFQAVTNNIQKISLLLSVSNDTDPDDLEWTGDLIVSVYPLQSTLDCALDIAPGTAIDFDPSNIPVAQLTLNYDSLLAAGTELNETPQPIDFIFSNTPIATGNIIKAGSYYVVSIKRAGSADKCAIELATGSNRTDNSHITFFNGAIWVDVPDEDLWFQVWTDASKVSDGQAYEAGHGIIVPKIATDENTGVNEDYALGNIQFVRNDTYYGIIEAVSESSVPTQDERTGERVLSQQQFVPQLSLVTGTQLISREEAADPLVIGSIADCNMKSISAGTTNVPGSFHQYTMIGNKCIFKVIDDPTDGYRYDLDILNLIAEMTGAGGVSNINGLINGKFTPNTANPGTFYRIAETELVSMVYGDLNGDGVVDEDDLIEFESLLGSDLNVIPTRAEYITQTTLFADDVSLTWQLLDDDGVSILDSGSDGILTADPQDGTRANFASATVNFNSYLSLSTKFIRLSGNISNLGNNGTFSIVGLIDTNTVDLQKQYYTSDTMLKVLQSDINGDMIVDSTDLSLMTDYVNKVAPFPANSSPANRIGTIFTAIRFTLESYVDRADDYTASSDRAEDLHALPDILDDGYAAGFAVYGQDLKNDPLAFNITKQMAWYDWFVNSTSNPKLVFNAVNAQSGYVLNECALDGTVKDEYPLDPAFDPGKNDLFVPNDLVINYGGALKNPDGYYHKVDLEIGTIILELPSVLWMAGEKSSNLFANFIADFDGNGKTQLGYKAMRFADCSTVGMDALENNQIRFNVSLQSLSPEIDGYFVDDPAITGVLVDSRHGIYIDQDSGILYINFNNLFEHIVIQSISTKIQIVVYLKKSGFNNIAHTISSTVVQNLFGF